jgi:release factor glutamine methyltransferase
MARLREGGVPSHTLAAELLLMHVLERDRAWLYAHPEEMVAPAQATQYFELVAQRVAGMPTQYLTGRQEFWGLEFEVTPDVLIPRPETEHVVEVALARLGQRNMHGARQSSLHGAGLRIADVGTGSGCLAVALARELPEARVFATELSSAALAVAHRNAARLGVAGRVEFIQCNLLDVLLDSSLSTHQSPLVFDLIVSNPPYVGRNEAEQLPREVREHEPAAALFAGERGFDIYEPLIGQARQLLVRGGILVLELGYKALEHVDTLVSPARGWTRVSVTQDLAGIPRVLAAERT